MAKKSVTLTLNAAQADLVSNAVSQRLKALDKMAMNLMKDRQIEAAKIIYEQMKTLGEVETRLGIPADPKDEE